MLAGATLCCAITPHTIAATTAPTQCSIAMRTRASTTNTRATMMQRLPWLHVVLQSASSTVVTRERASAADSLAPSVGGLLCDRRVNNVSTEEDSGEEDDEARRRRRRKRRKADDAQADEPDVRAHAPCDVPRAPFTHRRRCKSTWMVTRAPSPNSWPRSPYSARSHVDSASFCAPLPTTRARRSTSPSSATWALVRHLVSHDRHTTFT